MENQRASAKATKKLFRSTFLEALTRTHIAVPITLFILYAILLLWWSIETLTFSGIVTGLCFLAGLISFTWVEYQVHRRVFHLPATSMRKKRFQYTVHGVHHDYPKDKSRLAMPPILSLSVATLLLLVFKFVMGDYVFVFLPGFLTGYAAYLLVHYMVHAYAPPPNFLRILWIHHSIHHYKDSKKAFGVSSPLWDYVYGTMP
jgi:sterol desaturase/sphingolipid hydroxylase (fatty acid hydroxylase superfamily)